MDLFVEIVYVTITVVLILVVLLQAGRGGGLGTALGGGASQGVFGGGGGADFLAKLTQGLAAGFMICAVYLAYASAHSGSDRLKEASDDTQEELVAEDEAVDYERIAEPGGVVLPLPEAGTKAKAPEAAVPTALPEPAADEHEAPVDGQDAEGADAVEALPGAEAETPAAGEPAEAEAT
ncbi:MAG: preprotein translocase subunit SecG, partial [Myxococcales bacterium]|nr:preprotein translocase subunit SecG [Myxococcales bacterium]